MGYVAAAEAEESTEGGNVDGRGSSGDEGGSGGGGNGDGGRGGGAVRGGDGGGDEEAGSNARVWGRYDTRLPALSLWGRKNRILSWRGRSSPQSRVKFFVRTGTCADCAGRTASVKTRTFLSLQTWRKLLQGC